MRKLRDAPEPIKPAPLSNPSISSKRAPCFALIPSLVGSALVRCDKLVVGLELGHCSGTASIKALQWAFFGVELKAVEVPDEDRKIARPHQKRQKRLLRSFSSPTCAFSREIRAAALLMYVCLLGLVTLPGDLREVRSSGRGSTAA